MLWEQKLAIASFAIGIVSLIVNVLGLPPFAWVWRKSTDEPGDTELRNLEEARNEGNETTDMSVSEALDKIFQIMDNTYTLLGSKEWIIAQLLSQIRPPAESTTGGLNERIAVIDGENEPITDKPIRSGSSFNFDHERTDGPDSFFASSSKNVCAQDFALENRGNARRRSPLKPAFTSSPKAARNHPEADPHPHVYSNIHPRPSPLYRNQGSPPTSDSTDEFRQAGGQHSRKTPHGDIPAPTPQGVPPSNRHEELGTVRNEKRILRRKPVMSEMSVPASSLFTSRDAPPIPSTHPSRTTEAPTTHPRRGQSDIFPSGTSTGGGRSAGRVKEV